MKRIAAALSIVALAGCGEPGEGGGVFADTAGDLDTSDAVLFPELIDDSTPLPETETQAPETETQLPETETQAPETEPVDTAPADTIPADTAPPDTTPADTGPELVDTAPDTLTPSTCTYHTDCYPERLCGRWETSGELRCSEPCSGENDCAVGQICSKVPGSVQVGYCQDAPAGLGHGSPCTADHECRSRLCSNFMCTPLCLDEAQCAQPGLTCALTGDLAQGLVTSVCTPDSAQTIGNGQLCSPDGFTFDSSYCASGHCDLLNFDASVCAPICKSEADCAPAQECNIVIFSPVERADAVPYDPRFTLKTHDAAAGCYTPAQSGTLPDGSECTSRGQCRSNKCLPLDPQTSQTYCTGFCTSDAQCPGNMACKLEALTLSSEWLAAAGNQAPGSWTFVRVCKFR